MYEKVYCYIKCYGKRREKIQVRKSFLDNIVADVMFCGEGTTALPFLKFNQSARQSSLGGAYSSIAEDSNAIFSNPAGLSKLNSRSFGVGFTNYLEGSKLGFLTFNTELNKNKLGIAISGFSIDGIERRSGDASGLVPSEGSFKASDIVFIFGVAKENILPNLVDDFSAGINFKLISSKIDDSSGYAVAVDLGVLYSYSKDINFSFVVSNLGTKIKLEEESDNLPLSIKAGLLYKYKSFNFTGEVEQYIHDEKFYPALGIEYFLKENFALRLGYKFGYDTSNLSNYVGLSMGFGVITKDVGFNYAYVPFGDLGNINKFDISFKF